jgi:hypothetical protein
LYSILASQLTSRLRLHWHTSHGSRLWLLGSLCSPNSTSSPSPGLASACGPKPASYLAKSQLAAHKTRHSRHSRFVFSGRNTSQPIRQWSQIGQVLRDDVVGMVERCGAGIGDRLAFEVLAGDVNAQAVVRSRPWTSACTIARFTSGLTATS